MVARRQVDSAQRIIDVAVTEAVAISVAFESGVTVPRSWYGRSSAKQLKVGRAVSPTNPSTLGCSQII
jgi:hypothetical protein